MRRPARPSLPFLTTLLVLFAPEISQASCGAAICTVNTQWESQGVWMEPGLRLNLRYEYTRQDQLRSGTDKVEPSGVLGAHDELGTLNRNLLLGMDYAFDPNWALALQAPFVQRSHRHVHNDIPDEYESWDLRGLGDLRVIGRYQRKRNQNSADGLQFGLKLPTGSFNETNSAGQTAERSLQPGTGTTDLLLGAYTHTRLKDDKTTLFMQAMWQRPLGERSDYAAGQQVIVDGGLRYATSSKLTLQLQLNASWKDRDQGLNAEPAESGGHSLFLSPGASYALNPFWQVYAFVQLPLYQYVNGTQLTADWSALAGISWMR